MTQNLLLHLWQTGICNYHLHPNLASLDKYPTCPKQCHGCSMSKIYTILQGRGCGNDKIANLRLNQVIAIESILPQPKPNRPSTFA